MSVAAVVLAAGAGSRFGGPTHKLLAPFRGRPVLAWVLEAATAAALADTFVVTGCVDVGEVIDTAGLRGRLTVVDSPEWADGQSASLRVGLEAVRAAGHDAAVIGLGDQPLVPAEAWRRVADADASLPIVVATYRGRRRNPVRLARSVWREMPPTGDVGAREVMARRPELTSEIACPGEPADVDTLEDLTRWS